MAEKKSESTGTRKRKTIPTQELFKQVLDRLDRIDGRLASMETRQTLTESAWQRQGTVVEEINKRCMEKLGLKCPLVQDEENGDGENGQHEG